MTEVKEEVLLTHAEPVYGMEEPPDCPIAKIQETCSLLSGEIESISTPSPSRLPGHGTSNALDTPSHAANKQISRFKFDSEEISICSDTLSVTAMNPQVFEPHPDERRSLLNAKDIGCSHRASVSSSTASRSRPGSRASRQSRRSRGRKSSQNEPVTRGDLLMEMARQGSTRSRDCTKSVSSQRESMRDKNAKKKRKNSDSTTSCSSSASVDDVSGSKGKGFPGRGKRGNMTAKEAVKLGDVFCGCLPRAKFLYFVKPFAFLIFGVLFISGGLAFTVLHFMYEDSLTQKNPPYFTYGTITFSTGLILFMVGLVWIPIKKQKWDGGMASPMLAALDKWREEQSELEMKPLGFLVSAVPALAAVQAGALTGVVNENKKKKGWDAEDAEEKV